MDRTAEFWCRRSLTSRWNGPRRQVRRVRHHVRVATCACVVAAGLGAQPQPPTVAVPPPLPGAPDVRFEDVTARAGIAGFRHVAGSPEKRLIIEALGSGVAMLDLDGDGWLDLYLVNGGTIDHGRQQLLAPRPAAFFRNRGDGTFVDRTAEAGLGNHRWGQGVCAGDYDNDGHVDLFVANLGTSRLYRAQSGRFTDVAPAAGVAVQGGASGCAFGDYDHDGWLDLFVSGYVVADPSALSPRPPASAARTDAITPAREDRGMAAAYTPGATECRYRGTPVMCGPRGLPGERDYLFRNNRDGTFTDTSVAAGVHDPARRYGFGVAWVDADGDGWLDLIVANDSGPNHVYRNRGDGTFEDVSYVSGAALDGSGREQAHMGLAIGDYDNDGRPDVHITNFADDFNVLYHNVGDFTFDEVSHAMGIGSTSMPFLGWGTDFIDYDNDGWRDLLVVNGHVYPQADRQPWHSSYAQRPLLFRNLNGTRFEDLGASAGPALATALAARGSAVGDVDGDGGLDILVGTLDGAPLLARNVGAASAGHWLSVRLIGDPAQRCPRDAVGSTAILQVGARRLHGEVSSGRGQVSQSDTHMHFGLGAATAVESLTVRWSGGVTRTYAVDRVDTRITIDQRLATVQASDESSRRRATGTGSATAHATTAPCPPSRTGCLPHPAGATDPGAATAPRRPASRRRGAPRPTPRSPSGAAGRTSPRRPPPARHRSGTADE